MSQTMENDAGDGDKDLFIDFGNAALVSLVASMDILFSPHAIQFIFGQSGTRGFIGFLSD